MATTPRMNRSEILSLTDASDAWSRSGAGRSNGQADELATTPPGRAGLEAESTDGRGAAALAAAYKAIGHPVRIGILEILTRQVGQVCVCDIESRFDLSQPTVSHHLRVLRRAGLLESERRGTWIYYSVREEGFRALHAFLQQLLHGATASAEGGGGEGGESSAR